MAREPKLLIAIRFDLTFVKQLDWLAKREGRTRSNMVRFLLMEGIANYIDGLNADGKRAFGKLNNGEER